MSASPALVAAMNSRERASRSSRLWRGSSVHSRSRALLRAELDAASFRLDDLERDDVD
ncbi:hypothetical protein [Streptomyces niveus]|uniref:hypothetical protein n=1 Tax=Streptomyces niveus TaxID=193462 RepID=UPI000ABB97A4|nr:hypothetical protein [Streptomyces niveus]